MVAAVQRFFEDGNLPGGINDTAIVLIPKGPNPVELKDFRPISLCNVIYKIISKCLVNRLRPFLEQIISKEQSAFVPGRLITDNALIAFECIHAIQRPYGKDFFAYKLDLSKAYDRVDWGFLKKVIGEARLSKQVGAVGHDMCFHCSLLCPLQWGALALLFPNTWFTTR